MVELIFKNGLKSVHSFDLWGTLVKQPVLGPRVLEAYQELMEGVEDSEVINQNIANYQGILDGDAEAMKHKKLFVDTVEDPLWPAYLRGDISVNFEGALYEDALTVMDDIAQEGEGLIVLTTGESPWVKQALRIQSPLVGETLQKVYSGDKSKAETYETTENSLQENKATMVSHTEDQMKGLIGILESPMRSQVNLIYVERTDKDTRQEVIAQGIDQHVRDLRQATYLRR